jgi:hypothetical protein
VLLGGWVCLGGLWLVPVAVFLYLVSAGLSARFPVLGVCYCFWVPVILCGWLVGAVCLLHMVFFADVLVLFVYFST